MSDSLLEVGLNSETGVIVSVTLINYNSIEKSGTFNFLDSSNQVKGIPIFDTSSWPFDGYKDEVKSFKIHNINKTVLICFSNDYKPSLKIINNRVSFCFDEQKNLIAIEVSNLSLID